MEKIKVEIQDGVYVDVEGRLMLVELGEIEDDETNYCAPAVRVTGTKPGTEGEEAVVILNLKEPTEKMYHFCKLVKASEFLGVL